MNEEIRKINTENDGLKIAVDTLGCKVNQAESEQITRHLTASGYRQVTLEQERDIYILNTCTVTATADSKARRRLRAMRRRFPNAFIIAIGCYAQRATGELKGIEGIDLVIGNSGKDRLIDILKEYGLASYSASPSALLFSGEGGRTRTFLKVQDGCHRFCSYCVVPLIRNQEASLAPEQVIEEIKLREKQAYREVVLTGVEVGSYDYRGLNIAGLLRRVLTETVIPRIRLSSLQPEEINTGLLKLWEDTRLCRHFHISLQSGSDPVLWRMNRRYNTQKYEQAIRMIRDVIPDVAVTTDVITGFPGEYSVTNLKKLSVFAKNLRLHEYMFSLFRRVRAQRPRIFPIKLSRKLKN